MTDKPGSAPRRTHRTHVVLAGALGVVASVASGAALAGAFFIPQQSITGLGRAFAGGAAAATDASTVFSNPAGVTELERAEATTGATLFNSRLSFDNTGSTVATVGTGGAPVAYTGGDGGNPFAPQLVPNIYVAQPLMGRRLWLGIGVTAPYGLALKYDRDWFGRYDSIKSRLTVMNIGPSAAYRLNDRVSLGAGIDVQYARAVLSNAVPDVLRIGGPSLGSDGYSELDGSDWSAGFNVGVLIKPLPSTRIGAHYRSGISHRLDGDNTISGLGGALAAANGRRDGRTDLELPDIVSLAVAHKVHPKLTLAAEAQWFNWSRFEEIRLQFDDGSPDQAIPQNYDDSVAVSIGFDYALSGDLTVRGGFRYDQTPTVDGFRQTSVPDADSYAVALGASYAPWDQVVVDLAYYYAWWDDIDIDVDRQFAFAPGVAGTVNVKGTGSSHSHIVGVNLRYRF